MFGLFKTSILKSGLLKGFTDYHSHILPGVDDGIKTMEDALEVLKAYERWGIHEVWLTPHIMEDIPNTTAHLTQRYHELLDAYTGPITLHLAAENMLDQLCEERLEQRDLLPIGPRKDHLLVETSYFNPPIDLYGLIKKIMHCGYRPVLAHPERYVYMDDHDYQTVKEMGVKFQANITSLVGAYGKEAQKKVEMLLKKGYIDLTGTDIHKLRAMTYAISRYDLAKKDLKRLPKNETEAIA